MWKASVYLLNSVLIQKEVALKLTNCHLITRPHVTVSDLTSDSLLQTGISWCMVPQFSTLQGSSGTCWYTWDSRLICCSKTDEMLKRWLRDQSHYLPVFRLILFHVAVYNLKNNHSTVVNKGAAWGSWWKLFPKLLSSVLLYSERENMVLMFRVPKSLEVEGKT